MSDRSPIAGDVSVIWMHLKRACQLLGLNRECSEYVAREFAPWAEDYLTRRVQHEIEHMEAA